MGGLLILLALGAVMAIASFLAGAIPLSMSLSQSQLRFISSLGVGILVGTSLIVIIPEGIEAVVTTSTPTHSHDTRHLYQAKRSQVQWNVPEAAARQGQLGLLSRDLELAFSALTIRESPRAEGSEGTDRQDETKVQEPAPSTSPTKHGAEHEKPELPTFYIGFSLVLGFVLMFLIDRVPRHATDQLNAAPTTRHISLDNLGSGSISGEEETDGFLGSLTPTPKQSRTLATTAGLVIHAAADGIAMGASATTANMKLGLIIFMAIMVHKAPAAFGLTSVLLKQGLSKRAARGHLIVFSLAAPVGALATYLLISLLGGNQMEGEAGQWWTGMLLLFSAGTFLYVAMHAMQEDSQAHEHHSASNGYADNDSPSQKKQSKPQMRDTLVTVVGILLPLLTQFGHHH